MVKVGSRVWSVLVSPVSPVGRYESTEVWSLQSYCRQTASHHLQSLHHSHTDNTTSPHLTSPFLSSHLSLRLISLYRYSNLSGNIKETFIQLKQFIHCININNLLWFLESINYFLTISSPKEIPLVC